MIYIILGITLIGYILGIIIENSNYRVYKQYVNGDSYTVSRPPTTKEAWLSLIWPIRVLWRTITEFGYLIKGIINFFRILAGKQNN